MNVLYVATVATGAVAWRRLAGSNADQDAGIEVMTAVPGIVGRGRTADQGVVVAAGARRRTHGDETAVVEGRGRMHSLPGAGMTGGTVARPRLADGRADQDAGIGVMTADTGIMRFGRRADQGIAVAVGTTGRTGAT